MNPRILSCGAGVQTAALWCLHRDGHLPPLDHVIFADTGWEPEAVYRTVWRLAEDIARHGIPFHVVTKGDLRAESLDPYAKFATMPLFLQGDPWECDDCGGTGQVEPYELDPDEDPGVMESRCPRCSGKGGGDGKGIGRRQCTGEYKLKPIKAKVRELLTGEPGAKRVPRGRWATNVVGISADEIERIKPSDVLYMRRTDPLVDDLNWTRRDCEKYLAETWPWPVARSACVGCPFHTNEEWRTMRDERPDEWADAVAYDRALRGPNARLLRRQGRLLGEAFLHADRIPLDEVDIDRVPRSEWKRRQGSFALTIEPTRPSCSPWDCHGEEPAA